MLFSLYIIKNLCLNHNKIKYKGGVFTIYEQMCLESKRLDEQINSLHTQIESLPEGKIICTPNGNAYKWYRSDGHKSVYIPKSERKLAEQLAVKKYLQQVEEDCIQEKRAIDFYLKHHRPSKAEEMLISKPGYQELLFPYFKSNIQQIEDWLNTPFEQSPKYPENKIHKTASGNVVRSKSEALIDMMLYTNRIPFRYECALQVDNFTIYPDFTIMHPKTGKIYYWEHFGKMDDVKYNRNIGERIQTYVNNGIIPTVDLIITYETSDKPLTVKEIENVINQYFMREIQFHKSEN